jgi:hypothetical protein
LIAWSIIILFSKKCKSFKIWNNAILLKVPLSLCLTLSLSVSLSHYFFYLPMSNSFSYLSLSLFLSNFYCYIGRRLTCSFCQFVHSVN